LRRYRFAGDASSIGAAAMTADDGSGADRARKQGDWRERDLKRAIDMAQEAGLQSYRVEISPDGTISIVVGAPSDTSDPDPYDDLLTP